MIRNTFHAIWDRWANLHPFLRLLILAVMAATIGLFALKPAYRLFKEWRTGRNLTSAQKAVNDVRMDDARDLSLTVLRAGNSCIEVFRILEKSTAALQDPRHGDIALAMMSHPESSDADRLNGFLSLAPNTALGLLGQVWASLTPQCQQNPEFATPFADRLLAENHLNEAASVLLAVPEAARSAALNRCLIRILIASAKSDGYDEAQRMIAAQFPASGKVLASWLDLLETIPVVSLQESLLKPIRLSLENPESEDPARNALMLTRLDYASRFPERAVILDQAIDKWHERNPVALAHFLRDLGLYQQLLDTLSADLVSGHPGLLPDMLEAMERTGAWPQAIALLDTHGHLLPKHEALAHRAMAAGKTGDSAGFTQGWNDAMREAGANSQATALLKLAHMARDAGMNGEAERAMMNAIRLKRGPLPLYADLKPLLNSLTQQERESTLMEICTIYLSFEPGNPVLLTQYIYLACLNNLTETKAILKAIKMLAEAFPKEVPIQCVLATVYLVDGQPEQAAATLDSLKLDPHKLNPGFRAAFLTTQVLNQRMEKDDPLIIDLPWKSLQPSERRKFKELIQGAKTTSKK